MSVVEFKPPTSTSKTEPTPYRDSNGRRIFQKPQASPPKIVSPYPCAYNVMGFNGNSVSSDTVGLMVKTANPAHSFPAVFDMIRRNSQHRVTLICGQQLGSVGRDDTA